MLSKLHCLFLLLLLAATSQAQTLQMTNARPHPLKGEAEAKLHLSRTGDTSTPSNPTDKCGFALVMQRAESRGFDNDAFEAEITRLVKRKIVQGRVALDGTVTVPLVFHVIYRTADVLGNSSANLSTAKFQAQVDQLNIDYANGAGSKWVVAANVPIRFCMALVDTAGRPLAEPGIDRINGQLRGWTNTNTQTQNALISYFDNTIKPASIWDPYSYVNVWTAAMTRSGLLGYATFPSFSTLPGLDNAETNSDAGVVIAWESVGSVANPGASIPYGYGRTLTHELGHYFGLRHIWGDATCGNDYCNDTPPQSGETTGCPTTDTLNNCTPLVRKMFENYMDYSNDACLNTFTNDQSLRSQAVMDNSPRRRSLIGSKACQSRAANAIGFATATPLMVSETGTSGGCPNTRSYTFRLYVSSAATGVATVNFNASGTSTNGKDFIISPASVTYTAGDTSAKTVTVTVIDDQVAEPDEKFTLAYSISGTGVVIGPDKQSISITVVDDDVTDNISVDNVQPLKPILLQNFDTSAGTIPTGWTTETYVGSLTSANQWTVSANGGSGTTGRSAHITNDTVLKPNVYTNTNPSDAYLFTPLLDASGLRDLNLVFKWRCRGEVGYDAGYIGYVPEGQAPTADNVIFFSTTFNGQSAAAPAATANLNLPPSLSGKKFYFVFNWYNDETAGNSPGFTVDSIVLTGKAYTVATTTDADTTFSHFSGQTVTYFSKPTTVPAVNRIIAKVSGITTDAGCITASIPSAGASRTLVNNGAFYRTDKVVQLTPAGAVPSASYSVTLYYTPAELAVWGAQIPVLKMMKLKESAPLNGPYQSGDVQIVTPVFTNNSAAGYYAYTGTFTGGFSRFMLVTPEAVTAPLPVSLLTFTATPQGKSILLQWSTSQEINNKGFALERSTDGAAFTRIGWVAGAGNSSTQNDYNYTDRFVQTNTLYYYRLRQTDMDGKEKLSGIEQARIQEAGVTVTVSPVPARDYVQVFVTGVRQTASLSLLNAQGQVVKQWQNINLFSQGYRLNISGMPAGAYVLKIDAAAQQFVKKITVER